MKLSHLTSNLQKVLEFCLQKIVVARVAYWFCLFLVILLALLVAQFQLRAGNISRGGLQSPPVGRWTIERAACKALLLGLEIECSE